MMEHGIVLPDTKRLVMTTKATKGEDLFLKHKTRDKKKRQISMESISAIVGGVDSAKVSEHLMV